MTRNEIIEIVSLTRDELVGMIKTSPQDRMRLHNARTVLDTALGVARMARSDEVAIGALRGSARLAGETLTGALDRDATVINRLPTVRDIATALVSIGS